MLDFSVDLVGDRLIPGHGHDLASSLAKKRKNFANLRKTKTGHGHSRKPKNTPRKAAKFFTSQNLLQNIKAVSTTKYSSTQPYGTKPVQSRSVVVRPSALSFLVLTIPSTVLQFQLFFLFPLSFSYRIFHQFFCGRDRSS